jgi:hypothetical protein
MTVALPLVLTFTAAYNVGAVFPKSIVNGVFQTTPVLSDSSPLTSAVVPDWTVISTFPNTRCVPPAAPPKFPENREFGPGVPSESTWRKSAPVAFAFCIANTKAEVLVGLLNSIRNVVLLPKTPSNWNLHASPVLKRGEDEKAPAASVERP